MRKFIRSVRLYLHRRPVTLDQAAAAFEDVDLAAFGIDLDETDRWPLELVEPSNRDRKADAITPPARGVPSDPRPLLGTPFAIRGIVSTAVPSSRPSATGSTRARGHARASVAASGPFGSKATTARLHFSRAPVYIPQFAPMSIDSLSGHARRSRLDSSTSLIL